MNEKEDVDRGLAFDKSIPFDHKVYAEMYRKNMVKEAKSIIEKFDIDDSKKDQIKSNNNYYVPYSLEKLPLHLLRCPIHFWRAVTGIELIHKEPTLKKLKRIWKNWQLMKPQYKKISDEKSIKLFGIDNKTHYENLINDYKNE